MAAIIIEIADAVVSELNEVVVPVRFSQTFTAQRLPVPIIDMDSMGTDLFVTVIPSVIPSISNETRTASKRDYQIDIVIQKKVSDLNSEIDPLVLLAEEFCNYFERINLDGSVCIEVGNDPVVLADHLRQMGVFTSVVTLKFRKIRS